MSDKIRKLSSFMCIFIEHNFFKNFSYLQFREEKKIQKIIEWDDPENWKDQNKLISFYYLNSK